MDTLENARRALEEAAREFSRILGASPNLWDSDPLLRAGAFCVEKYGKIVCRTLVTLDFGPISYETFRRALVEAERAGLRPSWWRGAGLAVKWAPAHRLADRLLEAARELASGIGVPVEAWAIMLPSSDTPGDVGAELGVYTCVPTRYGMDGLLFRLHKLLAGLEERGYTPAKLSGLEGEERRSPYAIGRSEVLCAGPVLWRSELREEPVVRDEAGDYMLVVDEDVERLYPADPDSMGPGEPHRLYWYLPLYEPPWPCTGDAVEELERVGVKVVDKGPGWMIVEVDGVVAEVRCGQSPGDNTVTLLEGDPEGFVELVKRMARAWAPRALSGEALEDYLEALNSAESLEEIVEIGLEAEDDVEG